MSEKYTLLDCYLAVRKMTPEERQKLAAALLDFSGQQIQKAIDRLEQKLKTPDQPNGES